MYLFYRYFSIHLLLLHPRLPWNPAEVTYNFKEWPEFNNNPHLGEEVHLALPRLHYIEWLPSPLILKQHQTILANPDQPFFIQQDVLFQSLPLLWNLLILGISTVWRILWPRTITMRRRRMTTRIMMMRMTSMRMMTSLENLTSLTRTMISNIHHWKQVGELNYYTVSINVVVPSTISILSQFFCQQKEAFRQPQLKVNAHYSYSYLILILGQLTWFSDKNSCSGSYLGVKEICLKTMTENYYY